MSSRRLLSVVLVAAAAVALVPAAPNAGVARAVDAPWTTPTSAGKCTAAQADSGDVANCVLMSSGLPETRGWPTPPFPEPVNDTVAPWVDLSIGSTGSTVTAVQAALAANGAVITPDGQFGMLTQASVKAYQAANALPVTGIVDQATADLLGVQNLTGGVFPPVGWKWLGWGYNTSPALAEWESLLATNTKPIGTLRSGLVRSQAASIALFEGFFAEIQAKGYAIGDAGSYVFRCTASSRKDCAGLTRTSLSNHSYGLATDINSAKNPMRTYQGIDGQSACKTPMVTDLPQWVVQVGQKWGLYWGGFGWSSGCTSPNQWRGSVTRDPMHFEFNGSPEQARAILRFNLGAGACIDRVDASGISSHWCMLRSDTPGAGTRIVVDTPAPAGTAAALVNIATTTPLANGYITAEECGPHADGVRDWSNGTVRVGRTASATAIVPLDAQGRFCLYQSSAFHTVVDVQGWFIPSAVAPNGNLFTPVAPLRTVDTRTQTFCTADSTCYPAGPVPAEVEVISTAASSLSAVATLVNITASDPTQPGYLTADTCNGLVPGPQTRSNLNFSVGDVNVTNLAVVPSAVTEQGVQFCTWSPRQIVETVDVNGFFAPASQGGLGYVTQKPARLLDTRGCWADPVTAVQRCAQVNVAGSTVRVKAPAGAAAVVLNIAAVGSAANGTVTPATCGTTGATSPAVQASAGGSSANLAVVPVGADGLACLKVSTAMHLVVDLVGTFARTGDLRFVPVSPQRLLDTRPPA